MRSATPSGHKPRADDWTCTSMGGLQTAASLFGDVGTSTSAGSRTPCGGFGGRLLSQEHTRVRAPACEAGSRRNNYFPAATFQ